MGLPAPVPVPPLPPIEDATPSSARLVPVPPGCAAPPREQAVFVGEVVAADSATARYRVDQVRTGSIEGFGRDDLVDVRYGDEVRFLDVGQQYIVSVGIDVERRVLTSRVRQPAPLFGGNEIAGVDRSDVACPSFDDPVRTLLADGTSVESGVLSPLKDAKGDLARAVLEPVGAAFLILIGVVALKHLVFWLGRSIRDLGRQPG